MINQYKHLAETAGAIEQGHFVFVSGVHSGTYMNKTAAFVDPHHSLIYATGIVDHFRCHDIEVIVAPELGAIPFMADVGMTFWRQHGIRTARVMATKIPGTNPPQFTIGRSQARFVQDKRVLVLEDVFTKGGSAKSTVSAVREVGGEVVAVGGFCNRGGIVTAQTLGVSEFYALIDEHMPDYPPEECPHCLAREPISTHLGKGAAFLQTERARELGLNAAV